MFRSLRPFANVLAISAMLLRALLPLGWMPSGDRHAPLVICPMMGGMMHAAPAKQGAPHQTNNICPFTAALAQLSAPDSPPLLFLPKEKALARDIRAIAGIISPRLYRPQAPRGPPVFA